MINGRDRWLLSGGIGCGKTAVRGMLEHQGWLAIDSDSIGHRVLEPTGAAFDDVARRWPQVVVDGQIDRPTLADLVFQDRAELRALERLTHPHIFGIIQARVQAYVGPVVVELPLLASALGGEWAQMIVDCDDETRIARLRARGMRRKDAMARMGSQPSRAEWLAAGDVVVPNHGSLATLRSTVAKLG